MLLTPKPTLLKTSKTLFLITSTTVVDLLEYFPKYSTGLMKVTYRVKGHLPSYRPSIEL